jgi:hypothetical protein
MAREYIKTGADEYTPIGDTQSFPDLNESYSADEARVGTWIDGKPLYQRTLEITVAVTTTYGDVIIPHGIPNILQAVEMKGVVTSWTSLGLIAPSCLPMEYNGSKIFCNAWFGNMNIHSYNQGNVAGSYAAKVTLKYTKNTD